MKLFDPQNVVLQIFHFLLNEITEHMAGQLSLIGDMRMRPHRAAGSHGFLQPFLFRSGLVACRDSWLVFSVLLPALPPPPPVCR